MTLTSRLCVNCRNQCHPNDFSVMPMNSKKMGKRNCTYMIMMGQKDSLAKYFMSLKVSFL